LARQILPQRNDGVAIGQSSWPDRISRYMQGRGHAGLMLVI
jgi:hypothetical protein